MLGPGVVSVRALNWQGDFTFNTSTGYMDIICITVTAYQTNIGTIQPLKLIKIKV